MACSYTNIPNWMFEDLLEGKLNNKQFLILCWLRRRANWSTGITSGVSAVRIIAEMWPDELEGRQRPSERTIQRELKRLRQCGYITSFHVLGQKRSYKIMLHNYVALNDGEEVILNPKDTTDYRDLPSTCEGDDDGDSSGDVTVTCRGRDGDSSAYTLDSLASLDSSDSLKGKVSKSVSEQAPSLRSGLAEPLLAGRSELPPSESGTGSSPVLPISNPEPQSFLTERMRSFGCKEFVKGSENWSWNEKQYRSLFGVYPNTPVSDRELVDFYEVLTSTCTYPTEVLPVEELLGWVKENKKGKLAIRTGAQLNKAWFSENPNGLRRQFERYLSDTYGSACPGCGFFPSVQDCACADLAVVERSGLTCEQVDSLDDPVAYKVLAWLLDEKKDSDVAKVSEYFMVNYPDVKSRYQKAQVAE